MQTLRSRIILLAFAALLLVSGEGYKKNLALAQDPPPSQCDPNDENNHDPCFSNVNDILQGRRYLLRIDDVLMMNVNESVGPHGIQTSIIPTTNSNLGPAQTTDPFIIQNGNPLGAPFVAKGESNAPTALGRVVNVPRDVIVSLLLHDDNDLVLFITDPQDAQGGTAATVPTSVQGLPPAGDQSEQAVVLADFDGDSYAEVLIAYLGGDSNGFQTVRMRIVKPVDVNDLSKGVTFGPEYTNNQITRPLSSNLKAGDVNGDGFPEILSLDDAGTLKVYTVDPKTFEITQAASVSLNLTQSLENSALITGRFRATPFDDVIVAGHISSDPIGQSITVVAISGDLKLALTPMAIKTVVPKSIDPLGLDTLAHLFLAKGPLTDWFAGQDLLVVGAVLSSNSQVLILSLDNALNLTKVSETNVGTDDGFGCIFGLAVGNFDHQQSNGQHDPALQIATLWRNSPLLGCLTGDGLDNPAIRLWSVTPPSEESSEEGANWLSLIQNVEPIGHARPSALALAVGDTQGRSLVLGAPTVVRVYSKEPQLILDMPPMHVDWVTPVNETSPQVLNLSAVNSGFYSTFQVEESAQSQTSQQHTTSYTHSVSVSATEGYQWGSAATGSVTATVTETAGEMHQNSVSKLYKAYQKTPFTAASQTGFDDEVWYTQKYHNIYVYPVIGHVECLAENPGCGDEDKFPLNVMFSAPDTITQKRSDAADLEWYHPLHEPGNIFSYPWDQKQLESQNAELQLGTLDLLTESPTQFFTDGSSLVEQVQWQSGASDSQTSGTVNNITWGTSMSVSYKPPKVTGGAIGSLTLSYNGSDSISSLNTSTTTLAQSTGIGINKPGTFPDPLNYQYGIMPFIYGSIPDINPDQQIDLGTQIQTKGILRAAFTADPKATSAGWWQTAYPLPDVALNHPARWHVSPVTSNSPGPNCIRIAPTSYTLNCATFNQPNVNDVWTSEFYWMKGLLITPADANGEGPQITQAKAGDQILLRARVYNYSLTDMPAGSSIVVQFYGQPWDHNTHQPAGDAFLIENVEIPALPGFNSTSTDGNVPNWAIASTTKLDTAAYSDQYLAFWVLVVLKDANGNPLPEMPGHGLTGVPPTVSSIAEATSWLEPYSNNLGFYKSLFYISPQQSEVAQASTEVDTQGSTPLEVLQVQVSPQRALLHQKVTVSAQLRAGDAPIDGATVFFYDRDPAANGEVLTANSKAFDVEGISHIRANDTHLTKVPFRPRTCGRHTIFVVADPGSGVPAEGTATVEVNIDPVAEVAGLRRLVADVDLPRGIENSLDAKLKAAQQAFRKGNTTRALKKLDSFQNRVNAQRGKKIPEETAEALLAESDRIRDCAGV